MYRKYDSGVLGNVGHFDDGHRGLGKTLQKISVVTAMQGGMRLLRRTKIFLHTQMNLHFTTFKPASAALRELRRLGNLAHAKQIAIEVASRVLPARRHGELDVIDRGERHSNHAVSVLSLILYRSSDVKRQTSATRPKALALVRPKSEVRDPTSGVRPVRIKH